MTYIHPTNFIAARHQNLVVCQQRRGVVRPRHHEQTIVGEK
jgi:hypothetical protein